VELGILPGDKRIGRLKKAHWLWLYLVIKHREKQRMEDLAKVFGTHVPDEGVVPLVSLLNPESWQKFEEWKRSLELEKASKGDLDDLSDEELKSMLDYIDAKLSLKRMQ